MTSTKQMSTIKSYTDDFIKYCLSILPDETASIARELKAIRGLFSKYDDEALRGFLYVFLSDSEFTRSLTSFNSSLISKQSLEIPVKSNSGKKSPKLRIGVFYKMSESMAEDKDHEHSHLIFMTKLLRVFEDVAEGELSESFMNAKDLYNRMQGEMPESNNIIGLLESMPGLKSTINGFMPPELLDTLRDVITKRSGENMSPSEIKDLVNEVLDKVPAIESQRPFIKGIIEKIISNPELVAKMASDPSSALSSVMGPEGIANLLPMFNGGGPSAPTGGAPTVKVNEMMSHNPYG